jgi:hypothetical protein
MVQDVTGSFLTSRSSGRSVADRLGQSVGGFEQVHRGGPTGAQVVESLADVGGSRGGVLVGLSPKLR